MKYFMISILVLIGINTAKSQHIQGSVKDNKGDLQPFVNLVLLTIPDSTLVTGAVSDEVGNFKFSNLKAGKYLLKASSVGFLPYYSNVEFPQNQTIDIILQTNTALLSEVVVKGKKPVMEAHGEKLVFNVEAATNTVGLNGLEVLRKSPGVTIDQQNNLMLKGRSKVQVYINGKPSMIQGSELASFLKGLRASDIASIEMSTTPGASYDAAGGGGVINIQLKSNLKAGLNGSVSTTAMQGRTPKGEANVAVNYSDAKWNITTSISSTRGVWRDTEEIVNMTSDNKITRTNSYYDENRNGLNLRLRSDYKISKKSTLGVNIMSSYNNEDREGVSNTLIFGNSTDIVPQTKLNAFNNIQRDIDVLNLGLNYRFENDKKMKWGIDADWNSNKNKSNTYQPNFYLNTVNNSTLFTRNYAMTAPVSIDIKMVKTDFEIPLKAIGKLNFGAKYSNVESNNNFDLYDVSNSERLIDSSQSNHFNYLERIAAGYVSLSGKKGSWEYSLGLRLERTHTTSTLTALRQNQNRLIDTNYVNIFPTLALTYNLNENNAFSLAYRYSIDRPVYTDLNPFERRVDDYNSSRGNPFLRPQFTNTVELGYTFLQSMNFTLNYSYTKDYAAFVTDRAINPTTKQEVFYDITRNLDKMQQYGINLSFPVPITNWWQGFANIYANYTMFKSNLQSNKVIDRNILGGGLWIQQQMNFGKGWEFDISGWYALNSTWGVSVSNPMGVFDAGVSKKILKEKGSLKFTFNDLFKGSFWDADTKIGNFTTINRGTWEGRYIAINFNYRFGLIKTDLKFGEDGTKNGRRR